jgi:N-acetylmuramoyl-L-alanine amidase
VPKVFLGVGHGGTDSGAIGNGFNEKNLNLSIALTCNDVLIQHGVTVLMSRTKDENDNITDEIIECNNFKPDLAVDIHNNAGGGEGAECYYHHRGGKGKILAENILTEIVKIGQNSRGTKVRVNSSGKDYYAFIRETTAPAIIIECAFIDNAEDIQILNTLDKQEVMGTAIAKGILRTLGIPYVKKSKLYRVQVGAYSLKSNAVILQNKLKAQGYDAFIVESQ